MGPEILAACKKGRNITGTNDNGVKERLLVPNRYRSRGGFSYAAYWGMAAQSTALERARESAEFRACCGTFRCTNCRLLPAVPEQSVAYAGLLRYFPLYEL